MFRCPASFVTAAHRRAGYPVWQYEFDVTPVNGGPVIHSSELPYVFEGRPFPRNAQSRLQDYWVHFAKDGDPNFGGSRKVTSSLDYVELTDWGPITMKRPGGSICDLLSAP
jgi:carboxylesterase type B